MTKIKNLSYKYAVYYARYANDEPMIKLLSENKYKLPSMILYNACIGGSLDIVQTTLENGATDLNGGLKYACVGGHTNIIDLIPKKGL